MPPGAYSLLFSSSYGILFALLGWIFYPAGFSQADRLTVLSGIFVYGSLPGLAIARFKQSNRQAGCLTGPQMMGCWAFILVSLVPIPATLVGVVILLAAVGASWVSLRQLSLVDLLAFLLYAFTMAGLNLWVASLWPGVNVVSFRLPMLIYVGGVVAVLLAARGLQRLRH